MAKKKKPENIQEAVVEIPADELQTITVEELNPNQPELMVIKEEIKEDSVFSSTPNEIVQEKVKEDSVFTQKEEVKEKPKENKKEPVFKTPDIKPHVFQLTYYEGEKELTFFSQSAPTFIKDKGIDKIVLQDCFKKYIKKENILGKKLVQVSYKGKDKIQQLDIDLRLGVVIKSIEETAWMRVEQERAEKMFTEKVLAEYRALSKQLTVANDDDFEKF